MASFNAMAAAMLWSSLTSHAELETVALLTKLEALLTSPEPMTIPVERTSKKRKAHLPCVLARSDYHRDDSARGPYPDGVTTLHPTRAKLHPSAVTSVCCWVLA
ncbi:hypothetical protein F5Y07DRAFT_371144 [Xylaria sp. FL0933]|nr:hypothetical protein F5Y07DRAFT_371144 [Xylaria sp. FL0933]